MMTTAGRSTRRGSRRARAGFTLSEIMIAMGVIVVGLGMAAGAFHAGIKKHKTTVDDILRTMIGENALAIARVRLHEKFDDNKADGMPMSDNDKLVARPVGDGLIGPNDKRYPVGYPSGMGYLLYANRVATNENDFLFMVIPYTLTAIHEDFKKDPLALANCEVSTTPFKSSATITANTENSSAIIPTGTADLQLLLPAGKTGRKVVDIYPGKVTIATVTAKAGRGGALIDKAIQPGQRPIPGRNVPPLSVLEVRYNGQDVSSKVNLQVMLPFYFGRTSLPPAPESTANGS